MTDAPLFLGVDVGTGSARKGFSLRSAIRDLRADTGLDACETIRREGAPKEMGVDPANPLSHFREATWDEALALAADGLKRLRADHGGTAVAGFGSAKCSNEEAYLFQKLVRTGFGTNNVDHCTRLCHASSVAGLLEGVGSGAVSAPFMAATKWGCSAARLSRAELGMPSMAAA